MWNNLPPEIVQMTCRYLSGTDIDACSKVCSKWGKGCEPDVIWRKALLREFYPGISPSIQLPVENSWRLEYERLKKTVPCYPAVSLSFARRVIGCGFTHDGAELWVILESQHFFGVQILDADGQSFGLILEEDMTRERNLDQLAQQGCMGHLFGANSRHGVTNPQFSPDNSKVLLVASHWPVHSCLLYKTGKRKDEGRTEGLTFIRKMDTSRNAVMPMFLTDNHIFFSNYGANGAMKMWLVAAREIPVNYQPVALRFHRHHAIWSAIRSNPNNCLVWKAIAYSTRFPISEGCESYLGHLDDVVIILMHDDVISFSCIRIPPGQLTLKLSGRRVIRPSPALMELKVMSLGGRVTAMAISPAGELVWSRKLYVAHHGDPFRFSIINVEETHLSEFFHDANGRFGFILRSPLSSQYLTLSQHFLSISRGESSWVFDVRHGCMMKHLTHCGPGHVFRPRDEQLCVSTGFTEVRIWISDQRRCEIMEAERLRNLDP